MSTQQTNQPPKELLDVVSKAYEQEVEQHSSDGEVGGNESAVLDGYCHTNALALARLIQDETDHTPYLVWGGVADGVYRDFETIDILEESGRTHFWVEVRLAGSGRAVTMELSSESAESYNETYCEFETPNEYLTMGSDPSYIRYCTHIKEYDLISSNSYQSLQQLDPSIFADTLPKENP